MLADRVFDECVEARRRPVVLLEAMRRSLDKHFWNVE
jgi:hypothetical protein